MQRDGTRREITVSGGVCYRERAVLANGFGQRPGWRKLGVFSLGCEQTMWGRTRT